MVNEISTIESLLDNGILLVIAALFLLMVWRIFAAWQKGLQAKEVKDERREKQQVDMLKSVTAALERSNSVIEASNRVIEGNQAVLEQVLQRNAELVKSQEAICKEVDKNLALCTKIYTDLRVLLERGKDG